LNYRRLLPDTGGIGEFSGGPGQEVEIENTTPYEMIVSLLGQRTRIAARGVRGGGSGALRRFLIDGKEVDGKDRHTIAPKSVLRIQEAGGGGLGDPARRSAAVVRSDIERGYVTPTFARKHYPDYASDA
jgi:N-methylhydantoinase B